MFKSTLLTLKNHQIIPYKKRLKFKNMLAVVCILLINFSVCYSSVINSVRDNRVTYQSQLAKDLYLKSLRETLQSQLQNISNSATASVLTSDNISKEEFTKKYTEYLQLVESRRLQDEERLNSFYTQNSTPRRIQNHRRKRAVNNNDLIFMHFDLPSNILNDTTSGPMGILEEAYLAVQLVRSKRPKRKPRKSRQIRLHAYQLTDYDRVWLDTVNINLTSFSSKLHRKAKLNVFRAVNSWIQNSAKNLGIQIYCENCHAHLVYIVHEEAQGQQHPMHHLHAKLPTLHMDFNGRLREKRHRIFKPTIQDYSKQHHVKCSKKNEKCCRRQLKVQFKELAGLDFVIQPKMFDAGYCMGTCPTAYNPLHEHAVLQGRLADLGKYNVPRPCCTPSLLSDIDVLHVDEEDNSKLKVTTFKNMRVLQCACNG